MLIKRSHLDPRAHPYFYKLNVRLVFLPGLYSFHNYEQNPNKSDILSIVKDNVDIDCSGHRFLLKIGAALLTHYPNITACRVTTYPDLHKTFALPGLKAAYVHLDIRTNLSHGDSRPASIAQLVSKTTWNRQWDHPPGRNAHMDLIVNEWLGIGLEQARDPLYDALALSSTGLSRPPEQKLEEALSTFAVHQVAGQAFVNRRQDMSKESGLRYSQIAFEAGAQCLQLNQFNGVGTSLTYSGDKNPKFRNTIWVSRELHEQRKSVGKIQRQNKSHCAYIALGSNVGDRLSMIDSACDEMRSRGITVRRTSHLYETKPMYVEDQQFFINGACEV